MKLIQSKITILKVCTQKKKKRKREKKGKKSLKIYFQNNL